MLHELKILPEFFEAVESGEKSFEVRKKDRDFIIQDSLLLREWDPDKGYTGRETRRKIEYILEGGQFGIEQGYVVMAIK